MTKDQGPSNWNAAFIGHWDLVIGAFVHGVFRALVVSCSLRLIAFA
jgi:hypothetical protein